MPPTTAEVIISLIICLAYVGIMFGILYLLWVRHPEKQGRAAFTEEEIDGLDHALADFQVRVQAAIREHEDGL